MAFRTFFSLASLLLLTSDQMSTRGAEHFHENGEPTGKVAIEGESCQFNCKFGGLGFTNDYFVGWESSKAVIGPRLASDSIFVNGKFAVSTNLNDYGSRLVVNNITINEQAFYRCWLYEDTRVILKSRGGYLKVIQKPSFREMPVDQTVVEGESVILRCSLENFATEVLYIAWFLNGKNISRNYSINQSSVPEYLKGLATDNSKGSGVFDLNINRVARKDTDTLQFQCKVYLEGRRRSILKSRVAKITVIYPPANEFPKCNPSMLQDYYKEGGVLKTSCWAIGGNASVYFQWHKDGEMRNGTVFNNERLVTAEWTFMQTDDGKYINCYMKGPAILQGRQCSIGPIKVQTSTDVLFTIGEQTFRREEVETTESSPFRPSISPYQNVIKTSKEKPNACVANVTHHHKTSETLEGNCSCRDKIILIISLFIALTMTQFGVILFLCYRTKRKQRDIRKATSHCLVSSGNALSISDQSTANYEDVNTETKSSSLYEKLTRNKKPVHHDMMALSKGQDFPDKTREITYEQIRDNQTHV